MTKDAFWFPHDAGARSDPKMIRLRMQYGFEGVGIYWYIVEMLREANEDDYEIGVEMIEAIAFDGQFDSVIFDTFFDLKLFQQNETHFWSDSLKRRMFPLDEKKRKLSEAGKRGGRPSKSDDKSVEKPPLKPPLSQNKASPKPGESKEKRREEKRIEENRGSAATTPGSRLWAAYNTAFTAKYGVAPIRNAKTNSICKQIVDQLGIGDAANTVVFYLNHKNDFYQRQKHPLDLLLRDLQKINTERQTGPGPDRSGARLTAAEQQQQRNTEALEDYRKKRGL